VKRPGLGAVKEEDKGTRTAFLKEAGLDDVLRHLKRCGASERLELSDLYARLSMGRDQCMKPDWGIPGECKKDEDGKLVAAATEALCDWKRDLAEALEWQPYVVLHEWHGSVEATSAAQPVEPATGKWARCAKASRERLKHLADGLRRLCRLGAARDGDSLGETSSVVYDKALENYWILTV